MVRNKEKDIKVILFRGIETSPDSASFNRNEAVEKMVAMSFSYQVITVSIPKNKRSNLLMKIFGKQMRMLGALLKIYKISRDTNFRYIFFLRSVKPSIALIAWFICRTAGVKMAIERNEYPAVLLNDKSGFKKWMFRNFILTWHYRLFDVVLIMTDELIQFFRPHIRKNAVLMKLPMTVDFDRFVSADNKSEFPYIFYAGSLSEEKDGVDSLIRAFYVFSILKSGFKLLIAGKSKDGESEMQLQKLVESLTLKENVKFLGSVHRNDIPGYLNNAWLLVLPRPDSMQARGGFPTKLGEYLASGKPVIVTRVGEIPDQIREDEVYFISPDNIVEDLTEKMMFIAEHYAEALETGNRGKLSAVEKFSLESCKKNIEIAFTSCFLK